jgi:putative tricarboxylic transport membrane protein
MILAIVNIPLAGVLVRVLSIPPKILYPIILGLAFVGTYAISNSIVDFYLLVIFGVMGYFMSKTKIPTAPLILAVIVGNSMEQSFRQALTISNGSYGIFFKSTISIILFILTIVSIMYPFVRDKIKKKKSVAGLNN